MKGTDKLLFLVLFLMGVIWHHTCGLSSNKDQLLQSQLFYKRPQECLSNSECKENVCWGYEKHCNTSNRLFFPVCSEPARPWAPSMEAKHDLFWTQADFGYVKDIVDSTMKLCKPKNKGESLLQCSKNLRFCIARHLYIDFRRFDEIANREKRAQHESGRFKEDIFEPGEIGGKCSFDEVLHKQQGEHKSPLQSWYAELESFTSLDFKPSNKKNCDRTFDIPVVFMKLDAGVSLYHHFCDFYNLYASLHANGTFNDDTTIIMWDTSYSPYGELFEDAWRPFTKKPRLRISDFAGQRVCFKDVMFPLLPRMRGGLYYNTYVVPGCETSAMMQAFSEFMLREMGIEQHEFNADRVRVSLLARDTKYRNIINQDELVRAMKTIPFLDVQLVVYKYRVMGFVDQLEHSYNTDLFIGMHGAGLTHSLFLPDWAALFELHNTGDERCYHDLARQRGILYQTWEKDDKVFPEDETLLILDWTLSS
ncbi:EGF domain-specific O-linked N-acetylglucosamine transferase-like isoform X2 [Dysidea avara]|uniref:EGF domain-specific O-linked N-acetylglucosamine transferase-like isoform X2 n=1 Tax=Dysidea avara TaxID=196820 RepID=UPI003324CAD7